MSFSTTSFFVDIELRNTLCNRFVRKVFYIKKKTSVIFFEECQKSQSPTLTLTPWESPTPLHKIFKSIYIQYKNELLWFFFYIVIPDLAWWFNRVEQEIHISKASCPLERRSWCWFWLSVHFIPLHLSSLKSVAWESAVTKVLR